MADPPRPASSVAVASCRQAGITPVMITGDDARTAAAVARRTGILADADGVLTGGELARLDDGALRERVADTRVYARTNPEQKLRIVGAWKLRGAVVAMTGDGVNDAPALRRADIGVAMGVTGTDVSKEAADMVLADDDFATIVAAVEEGRRIYDNIRRFVRYLLTTNSGEIWVMFLASLLALPVPLLPAQILWVNLVTDGLPAIALGLEPAERTAMHRPPRRPEESILGGGLWQHALWVGLTMAAVCLGLLAVAQAAGWPWQTMVFTTLALLQLGHALAVRSERESFFTLAPAPTRCCWAPWWASSPCSWRWCTCRCCTRCSRPRRSARSSSPSCWPPRPWPSWRWRSRSGCAAAATRRAWPGGCRSRHDRRRRGGGATDAPAGLAEWLAAVGLDGPGRPGCRPSPGPRGVRPWAGRAGHGTVGP
jgi:magnesium-transporting ATPase (P-type)